MNTNDSGIEDATVWRAKVLRALAELRGHQDGVRAGETGSRESPRERADEEGGTGSTRP